MNPTEFAEAIHNALSPTAGDEVKRVRNRLEKRHRANGNVSLQCLSLTEPSQHVQIGLVFDQNDSRANQLTADEFKKKPDVDRMLRCGAAIERRLDNDVRIVELKRPVDGRFEEGFAEVVARCFERWLSLIA